MRPTVSTNRSARASSLCSQSALCSRAVPFAARSEMTQPGADSSLPSRSGSLPSLLSLHATSITDELDSSQQPTQPLVADEHDHGDMVSHTRERSREGRGGSGGKEQRTHFRFYCSVSDRAHESHRCEEGGGSQTGGSQRGPSGKRQERQTVRHFTPRVIEIESPGDNSAARGGAGSRRGGAGSRRGGGPCGEAAGQEKGGQEQKPSTQTAKGEREQAKGAQGQRDTQGELLPDALLFDALFFRRRKKARRAQPEKDQRMEARKTPLRKDRGTSRQAKDRATRASHQTK